MSSGDLDDKLASEEKLSALVSENLQLREYLVRARGITPIRTFFIPYGAGISADGHRVYISYDIQTQVNGVECENALVRHETTEWAVRKFCGIGEDYLSDPSGHRLGNRAEHDRVVALLDTADAWEIYCEIIDPQVLIAERESFLDKPVPLDLAMYPYDDPMRDKLVSAMLNPRSAEEWEKLYAERL